MRRCIVTLMALAALGATAVGCGSSGSNGSTNSGGRNQVTVGVIPIVDVAPIYLGKQKGFFSKRKIDLKLQPGTGGAATRPA